MNIQKYDGNIHPDEWIKDTLKHFTLWENNYGGFLNTAISLIDPAIELPTGINNIGKLCNALKEDISFTVFKTANKRKLQSLRYIPEREGGNTSKFISEFRKLCYNAEINDIKEQKKYFYQSLSNDYYYNYCLELFKREEKINSINDLIKEFEQVITDESSLIRNGSIVTLKHVTTGKYLSSIKNLCYTTGSQNKLVFVGSPGPNSLWKIMFNNNELATYNDTSIYLQHHQTNLSLGISNHRDRRNCYIYWYYKSPLTNHTEVNCGGNETNWKFNHSKLENYKGYLKSNDIINISIKKTYDKNGYSTQDSHVEFLRSHDIQFAIGNDTFQEVVCHHERLGGNDEWCIELLDIYSVKLLNG